MQRIDNKVRLLLHFSNTKDVLLSLVVVMCYRNHSLFPDIYRCSLERRSHHAKCTKLWYQNQKYNLACKSKIEYSGTIYMYQEDINKGRNCANFQTMAGNGKIMEVEE